MSQCKRCGKEVIWQQQPDGGWRSFDPEPDGNGGFRPGSPHSKTCPARATTGKCPGCLLLKMGLEAINDIDISVPLCPRHAVNPVISVDYKLSKRRIDLKDLPSLKRKVRRRLKELEEVETNSERLDSFLASPSSPPP